MLLLPWLGQKDGICGHSLLRQGTFEAATIVVLFKLQTLCFKIKYNYGDMT